MLHDIPEASRRRSGALALTMVLAVLLPGFAWTAEEPRESEDAEEEEEEAEEPGGSREHATPAEDERAPAPAEAEAPADSGGAERAESPQTPVAPDESEESAVSAEPVEPVKPAEPVLEISAPPIRPARAAPPAPDEPVLELGTTVVGRRKRPKAAPASLYQVELGNLKVVPRRDAGEALTLAPGVLTANHGGTGHANETFMRGFAAREGQDIEFTVDGVPLNEVSNPHGHGYADLHFLPPEFIDSVDVIEGPFDPEQADFAFAGSAHYRLGVRERGARVTYGGGLWNTHRLLLTYAPPAEPAGTFAGFEFHRSDGFGENRASQRALGLGRYQGHAGINVDWSLSAFAYAARFDQAGVVREDDIDSGRVHFLGTYDPNQGGESNRYLLFFDLGAGPRDGRFHQVTFLGWRTMRLRTNFTGWLLDDRVNDDGTLVPTQRGDGLEMRYQVLTAGTRGRYELAAHLLGYRQRFSLGYALRFDQGRSGSFRLRSVTAIPYRCVLDHEFTVLNLAGWLRTELRLLSFLALRGGVRLDAFSFGVRDRNQPAADREGQRIPDQTSQAFGFALNPRATLDFRLWQRLHLLLSYGQGTRSTEAAALSDNETAPFARAHVAEAGLTHRHGREGRGFSLASQLGYVFTQVDQDLLFSEVAGRNVLVGSSLRHAVLLSTRGAYDGWLDVLLNFGWTRGTLEETGELLPYIPELILRLDAAVGGPLGGWRLLGVPVTGRAGLGFTYSPGRPLPLGAHGDPLYLLDLAGEIRLWHVSLGVQLRNLLDLRYGQSEFNYASNFAGPTAPPSRVAERHFAAGEPFFVLGTLTLHLEDLIRSPEGHEPTEKEEER